MSHHDETMRRHPKVEEAKALMEKGRMSRRAFIRVAALVGVSAVAAYAMAGLPAPAFAQDAAGLPFGPDDPQAKKGGILKHQLEIQKMEDPATYSWNEASNQTRHIVEYLAFTGPDNVTRPYLAERWEASDDLKTWTFFLRRGVKWHNGDDFTTEDVKFNIERWCDPAVGSSNVGLSSISALVDEIDSGEKDDKGQPKMVKKLRQGAIEVVDDHTIRFQLAKPVLSFPEDLYNYPTPILHRSFKPPFSENFIGTGPFTLEALAVGDRCLLKRVTKLPDGSDFKYWGGEVYLDGIHYFNFADDNALTAFADGSVDAIYEFGVEQLEFAKSLPGTIVAARTAQTLCCRFHVNEEPFSDKRVRQALVKAVDNAAIKELVYPEGGDVGENHHVAPVHPDYFPLPPLQRDVEGAKALLKEAGKENLTLTIDCGNTDGPWHQTVCEAIRDQWQEIGVTLNVNVMPASKYWEIWTQTPFGATAWTHRPLGTMVMSLGYRSGVPWNESNYANPEFDKALDKAESVLDVEQRKAALGEAERILQDDAVMILPIWRPVYTLVRANVHGYPPHPTQYHQFNKVWVDAA